MLKQALARGPALLCVLAVWASPAPAETGAPAPEFTYRDVNPRSPTHGKSLALRELYAGHGLVLNFIASWCAPCWLELPAFQKLGREGGARVVCVAADEYGPPEDLLRRAEHAGLELPILLVPAEDLASMERKYAHDYLPSTYLIDTQGAIRSMMQGAVSEERLFGAVREHLGPAPTPATSSAR